MKRNTAIQLLQLLSDEEMRKLNKFLRSPYFNYTQPIITLFECLRKFHPDYEEQRIRPHIFWKKLYPGKAFSEQKYWTLNFQLRCLIERFMAIEEMEADETEFKKQLIKSHGRRNAHSIFEKEIKSLLEKIDEKDYQDIYSYSEAMWLKHDYFFNSLTDKYGGALYAVEDVMEDLDRFYILSKLRFASEIKNRERIFSKKVPIDLLEETLSASQKYEEENPAFLMYKNVLELYDEEKAEKAYKNGKKILEEKFALLSVHDQKELMLQLRNYAIRNFNKGISEYGVEIFELYKIGLERDLILHNGKIRKTTLLNIVNSGCFAKQYDWMKQFIEDYTVLIDEEDVQGMKNYCLGILYYHMKEYDLGLSFVENWEFSDYINRSNSKLLIIKVWYDKFILDKTLYELLISKIDSTIKYYRRASILSSQRKEQSINFYLATKQLVNLKLSNATKEEMKMKMKKYLSKETLIVSRHWLEQKI